MSSFRLRQLREDDAEAAASLCVETFGDARKLDAGEIRSWLRNTELRDEWLRVLELASCSHNYPLRGSDTGLGCDSWKLDL